MLNLYQLHIFVLVAQARTLSAAAEQLHLTQPAVSQQIRALEKSLAVELFTRGGYRMEPTAVARALLPPARELVQLAEQTENLAASARARVRPARGRLRYVMERTRQVLEEAGAQLASQVTLGCGVLFSFEVLYRMVRTFRERAPDLALTIERGDGETMLQGLRTGWLDLALVDVRPRVRGLRSQRLLVDEVALIVPDDHRWSHHASVPVSELAGEPLIGYTRDSEFRRVLEEGFDRQRVQLSQLTVVLQVDSVHDAIAAVGAGIGIAFVSKGLAQSSSSKTKVVAIEGVSLRREIFLVHGPEESLAPAGRRLEDFLRSPLATKLLAGER